MSCGLGSDPTLLWLWYTLEFTALIRPLAWVPQYIAGRAQKKKKKKKKKDSRWLVFKVLMEKLKYWKLRNNVKRKNNKNSNSYLKMN